MIARIELTNFKCFQSLPLNMGAVTLLSGINGGGKSNVIQSLLLLRQSWSARIENGPTTPDLRLQHLALNGPLVQLGNARDVLYAYAEEPKIGIGVEFESSVKAGWSFRYNKDADVLHAIEGASSFRDHADRVEKLNLQEQLARTAIFGNKFQYLGAERIGPRTSFPTSDSAVRQHRDLGTRGEFTTHFLTVFGSEAIPVSDLAHSNAVAGDIRSQVEAWLDFICPGTRLKLTPHPGMDLVQLEYQFTAGREVTDAFRPTNVGFGLTYTLPILVAVLSARPGALILLENPEAHLHPHGQARMGEFLAQAASAGIQIVVETHSDHVLNGVRLAVHGGRLDPSAVALHFFQREVARDENGDRPIHTVISPRMDRNGRIDKRPEGFFDEWDKSLRQLLKPRKR